MSLILYQLKVSVLMPSSSTFQTIHVLMLVPLKFGRNQNTVEPLSETPCKSTKSSPGGGLAFGERFFGDGVA